MASRTRNAIMDSCVQLLEERPISKITVKDVVEECGINRNTFYYHFQDLPTLIETIVQEEADQLIQKYATVSSLKECLEIAVEFTLKYRSAAMNIYNSGNRDIFERCLLKICEHAVTKYVEAVDSEAQVREEDKQIIIQSYKCECFGHIVNWMNEGMKEDFPKYFHRLGELREGMTREMFRRSMDS